MVVAVQETARLLLGCSRGAPTLRRQLRESRLGRRPGYLSSDPPRSTTYAMSLVASSLRASQQTARRLATVSAASRVLSSRGQNRGVKTQPAYEGHVPLNWFEASFLTLGSAFMSLANPRRGGA